MLELILVLMYLLFLFFDAFCSNGDPTNEIIIKNFYIGDDGNGYLAVLNQYDSEPDCFQFLKTHNFGKTWNVVFEYRCY